MNYFSFAWLIAIGCFAVLFLIHLIWCRTHPKKNSLQLVKRLFYFSIPCVLIVSYFGFDVIENYGTLLSEPSYSASIINAVVTSLILLFGCLAFYAGVDHSVRIRLIIELYKAGEKKIDSQEILNRYDTRNATVNRLQKMLIAGYINKDNLGNYFLTDRGRSFAKIVLIGKSFFKVGIGGELQ